MSYQQKYQPDDIKDGKCPECGSRRLLFSAGKVTCTNCGTVIGARFNKFGAKRQVFNGKSYDSKFEASVSQDLYLRKRANDIKDYETQYRVDIPIYNQHGKQVDMIRHKIDFRVHHNDGSYELIEAKGVETSDYKFRRRFLENLWLPEHPDHTYTVIKQNVRKRR